MAVRRVGLGLPEPISSEAESKPLVPLPGAQSSAYSTLADEVLFGGQAGGGKSALILMLARQQHHNSLLLRRTYPQLDESLVSTAREMLPGFNQCYNRSNHIAQFTDGRRIRFGHLLLNESVDNYKGPRYDLIAFDELTQFTQYQYEYLFSRAATTLTGQRVRIVATSNPDGEGADWVFTRWGAWLDKEHGNPAAPGELRWYRRDVDGKEVPAEPGDGDAWSRTFIPAKLSDNPHLAADGSYRRMLASLPEPLRSQLMNGDWIVGRADHAYQVISRAHIAIAVMRWKQMNADIAAGARKPSFTGMGVDVGRTGDLSVIAPRHAHYIDVLERRPHESTMAVAGRVHQILSGHGRGWARIDANGIGAGVYDRVQQLGRSGIAFNGSEEAEGQDSTGMLEFMNMRAFAWWNLREKLDPTSGALLALPDDPELIADLCAPRWHKTARGVIAIEDKGEVVKRIGRSPDAGDAVVLAALDTLPPPTVRAVERTREHGIG